MKRLIIFISFFFYSILPAQTLLLQLLNPLVNGNQVTYDVRASNVVNLLSMQYCLSYETDKLSFNRVKDIAPYLSEADFIKTTGYVCHNWIDPTLNTITLPDSSLLYRIVFNKLGTESGKICFAEESHEFEFYVDEGEPLTSFLVIDDCYPDTFEYFLTAIPDFIPDHEELHIVTYNSPNQLQFNLGNEANISFRLFDIAGRPIQYFPTDNYGSGNNYLNLRSNHLPGIYYLLSNINNHISVNKVLFY